MSERATAGGSRPEPGRGPVGSTVLEVGEDVVEALRVQVGALVAAHPGVLRLEPTLAGVVQALRRPAGPDGVQLVAHGRVVDVDVNLATRSDHQARATATELQEQLVALVAGHGLVPGSVEISVLRVVEQV